MNYAVTKSKLYKCFIWLPMTATLMNFPTPHPIAFLPALAIRTDGAHFYQDGKGYELLLNRRGSASAGHASAAPALLGVTEES